jgi:hypothetical protein
LPLWRPTSRSSDLAANLNKEIGTAASGAGGTTYISINSNVDFMALKAADVRACKGPREIAQRTTEFEGA